MDSLGTVGDQRNFHRQATQIADASESRAYFAHSTDRRICRGYLTACSGQYLPGWDSVHGRFYGRDGDVGIGALDRDDTGAHSQVRGIT